MKPPSARELWSMPELAVVPTLVAAIDGLLASLYAQHGTIDDEWRPGDPPTLREARALVEDLLRARRSVTRYARAVRSVLGKSSTSDEPTPF